MYYCPNCSNVMQLHNSYGTKTLDCRYCGQRVMYGHKDPSKDEEKPIGQKEVRQDENIVECKLCTGIWREQDLIPDMLTNYGAFYICPNCRNRIFVRF